MSLIFRRVIYDFILYKFLSLYNMIQCCTSYTSQNNLSLFFILMNDREHSRLVVLCIEYRLCV